MIEREQTISIGQRLTPTFLTRVVDEKIPVPPPAQPHLERTQTLSSRTANVNYQDRTTTAMEERTPFPTRPLLILLLHHPIPRLPMPQIIRHRPTHPTTPQTRLRPPRPIETSLAQHPLAFLTRLLLRRGLVLGLVSLPSTSAKRAGIVDEFEWQERVLFEMVSGDTGRLTIGPVSDVAFALS